MKIVVIGGSGLIGSKVVQIFRNWEHEVVSASPLTGVDIVSGEGLADVLINADIVVDLANPPLFDEVGVTKFFKRASENLLSEEIYAGVRHHVCLSVVGLEDMQHIEYMRAKKMQEEMVYDSGLPYTIVRSTQFMEFIKGIADSATVGEEVHLSEISFQPIAADDVAEFLVEYALDGPLNRIVQIAGPTRYSICETVKKYLKTVGDARRAFPTGKPVFLGGWVNRDTLVPSGKVRLGNLAFENWIERRKIRV